MTHKWLAALTALTLSLSVAVAPDLAEAKRLGAGKSAGMQRQMPAKAAPQTPAQQAQPAAPTQPGPTANNPAAAGAAAAAAAPAKRSWMGPLAGLAAGLGLAALASHFGFGEGLANFMMIALLAVAAFFVLRLILSRLGGNRQREALAGAGGAPVDQRAEAARPAPWSPEPAQRSAFAPAAGDNVSVTGVPLAPIGGTPGAGAATAAPVMTETTAPQLPEGFDLPAFERAAKMIFIRLQAANDRADLDDLREFTTPEMFASARLEIQERGGVAQQTDVEKIDAQLIDFVTEPTRQVASVRFHGLVREDKDAPAVAFDEIWHLVKPTDGSKSWAIAGIQQAQ
jgi:predicted lipid-binding transport protein (Tim44 family)